MAKHSENQSKLKVLVQGIERYIIKTLIALMSILLILATIELGYTVFRAIETSNSETFIIDLDNLMNVFGVFLLVVIGIELLDTIKVYFREHVIHVEVVLLVAIIAIARKIIVLDFDQYSGLAIMAIAAILLALAAGYYLIKKTGGCGFWPGDKEEVKDEHVEEKITEGDNKVIERTKTIRTQENLVPPGDDAKHASSPKMTGPPRKDQTSASDKKE